MSNCRITSWLTSLFNRVEETNNMKEYTRLTRIEVKRLEANIDMYNRDTMMEYFNISQGTYYKVKNRQHKYSTKEK